jgi:hypothetical protein
MISVMINKTFGFTENPKNPSSPPGGGGGAATVHLV